MERALGLFMLTKRTCSACFRFRHTRECLTIGRELHPAPIQGPRLDHVPLPLCVHASAGEGGLAQKNCGRPHERRGHRSKIRVRQHVPVSLAGSGATGQSEQTFCLNSSFIQGLNTRARQLSPTQLFALVKADARIDVWSIPASLCHDATLCITTQTTAFVKAV